ncbi:Signal peptide peptidase-like 4 [Dionaea muscipula]
MKFASGFSFVGVIVVAIGFFTAVVLGGDIVHEDELAPKRPGCQNKFVLVKVPTWIDGQENIEYVGVGARFGPTLESKGKHANQTIVAVADPPDGCSVPKNKLAGEVILVHRGNCSFTRKANIAEDAGASALLIINNNTGLFKMVCEKEADIDIQIPTVMLPKDAGSSLESLLQNNSMGTALYSPKRPAVDVAEVFLWLMAVGTILCASYWSAWSAREATLQQENFLKDISDELPVIGGNGPVGFVDISTRSAVLFVVFASCFLILLYKFMSPWFIEVLVVLFCIGGVEQDDGLPCSFAFSCVLAMLGHCA